MDFHCMKRKQLQALCKKHRIPANLSNLDMANKLTEFLREKENPVIQAVIKEQEGVLSETESINVVENGEVKKVRFSLEHELIEFTRSPEMKSRRNSVSRRDCNLSVENGESNKETVHCPRGRPKRTRELKLMEAGVNQKKRGMKALNCNSGKTIASDVDIIDDGELEVRSGRVTRLRGNMAAEGVIIASKREGKEANDDDKIEEKASDNVHNKEEIVDNRSRVTRSRAQKLTEAPAKVGKRGRKVAKNIGEAAAVGAETDSSSKRATHSDERMKGNGEELEEILVNKQIAGEHEMVEPQVLLRRSKRKVNMVGDSEMLTTDKKKHEDGEIKVSRKTSKPLASDVSQVDAEIIGSEVNPGRRAVLEIEEPIKKVEPRRSNRRMTMIESDNLTAENENICPVRSSVPQSDFVPEVPEDEKMVLHPSGVLRSRRKTLGPKLISATNDTDSAVENAEKLVSEPCLVEKDRSAVQKNMRSRRNNSKCKPPELLLDKIGGDSNIQQKNKVMKRKRGLVSGDVIKDNNDLNSGAQSMKGSSSKKVVSSHHVSPGIGESLSLDVQLSVSKDSESASNLCSKNIISDVDLTSIRKTDRKEEEVSNADSAGSSCMNLTNEEELANSDTNAAPKIARLEKESTVSEDQKYTSNIGEVGKGNSLLDIDQQESMEQKVSDADKNDPEAQMYSQMEDSGCSNKIDQVLAEGLDVSGEEGSAEASSSADSLLLGDQTDVKTDLKVAENEADECLQSCPRAVDHHNDLDHLEASSNILEMYNNNEDASQTAGEVGAFESYETDYTHSKSTLQLKVLSSGMTRHHGGDNVAEGNETFFHKCIAPELAETDEDGCSKDHRNSINHSSEFDMPDVSNGERDARIVSQDRGTFPSEYSVMNSDEKHEVFQAVSPTTICTNSADVNLKRGHEDDHQMTRREAIYIDEGINSEASEIREGKSSMGHKSKCDGDGEFSLANLFDVEGTYGITPQDKEKFSGEHSVKDFNEQGMLHGSPFVEPTSTCNSTGDHEANLSAEGGETYNYKDKQSELTEIGKSGCLKSHESSKDEDWELSGFNLFDEEKSTRIKPQNIVSVSAKYSIKDLNEVETFPDLSVASTTCVVNYNEVRESSISQETNPSTPSSVSETQEQQKSLLAKLKVANTDQMQEAWSNASVLAGNAVHSLKSYAEGEISQVAVGLSFDEDVNHAKYGLDKEGSAGACISDVKGCTISKIAAESLNDIKFQDSVETEQQRVNMLAGGMESDAGEEATHAISRQSWTEIELHNLFGTTSDEDAPPVLGDTFCQGTEIANMATTKNKSTAKNSGSLTKNKGSEMERENRNEGAKTKNKNVVLPSGFSDDNDIDENQLKFLFATPVKIISPNKMEESVASIKECSGTMKENDATESTPNEKVQNAGYEVENNLCIGASLSDYGGDEICQEMNEVESSDLLNTPTRILSGAGYDGCEALEDQLKQNKEEECLKGTNLITEEDEEHVILLAQSCLHDEATEKNIISSSGTHMLETLSCKSKAHGKSVEEMEQITEAVFELSDADLQKLDVPENSHLLTVGSADGSILREASIETSSDPEIEKNGSFQKDVADKGISPVLFSKVSPDCDSIRVSDDKYEGDDKDGKDIYGELHTNSEVAIKRSVSIGYNLSQELDQLPSSDELESTFKEAKGTGTTLGDLLPDIGGDDTHEKMNSIESVELKDTSTTALSKTEYDGCEASEEQLIEYTGESQKETNFITEDNEEKAIPLGQAHLCDEGTDNKSESSEENIISLSGSPNNLDKVEGCQDMLIDTSLSESLKSQREMAQSSEAALELSDADLQNCSVSKNSRLTASFEDDNISKEASLNTSSGFLVAELAITGIFDGQNAKDEGTSPHHSLKASSPVDDELTHGNDTCDLNGAKICDEIDAEEKSSTYMSDELHMNSEVAIPKRLTDRDNPCEEEADKLPFSLELESMFLEAKEAGTTGQDPYNIVAPAEHGSSVCGAASSIENLDAATPVVFNLNGDNEKNSEKAEDKKAAQMVQVSIQEVHFEENVQDDAHIVSNSPASEILKESDVADTIREYIDSESSLSVIFENSTASLPSDASTHEDDIAGRLGNSNDEDNMTEIKEQEEATLFMEPAQVSRPGCVPFLAEGTSVEVDSQKKMESEDVELSSTMRKNAARTILIHGTPGKVVTMAADMKENVETRQKRSNMGDITAARPAKRIALKDLKWN
ncbi:hypothetical protein C2S52_000630 [Perilla frutescens var. hirtella]|nr:hypothetical protein C2S52_000630 [Perilla frutescens var. hirtella]